VHHVEFRDAEGRGNLVLYNFGPDALANNFFAVLELADPADIDPARGVKL
jgi:hypothetical protein